MAAAEPIATTETAPLIRCVSLTKYFGGVLALDSVSLDLYPGEVVALVGDNGAGKSTLVRILSGIHQPDDGEIWLGEAKVERLNPHDARQFGIETVYQNLSLCDNLGAAANVVLGQEPIRFKVGPLRVLDQDKAVQEAKRRISDVGVELNDFTTPVRRLSGGQRQAIAIARATVQAHRLIMLDEPTAALGVRQTRATLDLIRHIAGQNVAVIMISHNLDDVFAVADRAVALRLGHITLESPLRDTSREEVVAAMTGISFQSHQETRDKSLPIQGTPR